ncbi:MAG TPA: methyl-accepting chemotaxis protein [bacterium]|nr:methyl-accepting chemotaxis protein [bacterium]
MSEISGRHTSNRRLRRWWAALPLRRKVAIQMLPLLLPVLGIIYVNHSTGVSAALSSGHQQNELLAERGAANLSKALEQATHLFRQHTEDDVYGMAIEFDTLDELEMRLKSIADTEAFRLVVLTDNDGACLRSHASPGGAIAEGAAFRPFADFAASEPGRLGLLRGDAISGLGLEGPFAFGLHSICHDSAGEPNGHLFAILDPALFSGLLEEMHERHVRAGYSSGSNLLISAHDGALLAQAGRPLAEASIPALADAPPGAPLETNLSGEPCLLSFLTLPHEAATLPLAVANVVTERELYGFVNQQLTTSVVIAGITLLILLAMATAIGQRISRPIQSVADRLTSMANGQRDLSVSLPITSQDELGALAAGFNAFVADMADMIVNIRSTVEELGAEAEHVRKASQFTSERSMAQASHVQQITTATSQISESTSANAAEAADARKASASTRDRVTSGKSAITSMAETMSNLKEASSRASSMIEVIDGIAFQVNLLALNAAVEAARAGDAGRGFAVVAEEVRSLAMRSAKAARDSSSVIGECDAQAQICAEHVERVQELLSQIEADVCELDTSVDRIADASASQASGVESVRQSVAEVDETTTQSAATAQELAASSNEAAQHVGTLLDLLRSFRVPAHMAQQATDAASEALHDDVSTQSRDAAQEV